MVIQLMYGFPESLFKGCDYISVLGAHSRKNTRPVSEAGTRGSAWYHGNRLSRFNTVPPNKMAVILRTTFLFERTYLYFKFLCYWLARTEAIIRTIYSQGVLYASPGLSVVTIVLLNAIG